MPKVSEEHLASRRAQILAGAAERFTRDGFHRTSMQDLIEASGLSAGAVYRYFSGKDEIIGAIAREALSLIEQAARAQASSDELDLASTVAGLLAAFHDMDRPADRPRLAVQAWGEMLRNDTLAHAVRPGMDAVRVALRDRVVQAQRRGAVDASSDPDAVARVLVAVVEGYILQAALDPCTSPEEYVAAFRALLA